MLRLISLGSIVDGEMENRINIGELDTLIKLQQCIISTGDMGQKKYSFSDHSKVWAKVSRSITEGVGNHNLEEGNYLQVTIYKVAALSTRWRAIVGGIPYQITAIDPVSRFSPLCILTLESID